MRESERFPGAIVPALVFRASTGVYVTGDTFGALAGPNAGASDPWIARYDSTGLQLLKRSLGTNEIDEAWTAAPDATGGGYVVGTSVGSLGGTHSGSHDAWMARFDDSCPPVSTYCTASTTSIPGCQAAISGSGSPSLAQPTGFTISAGDVPGGILGNCLFGKNRTARIPLGMLGERICVQPPVLRARPKNSAGTKGSCNGQLAFTLQDLIDTSPIVVAGAVLHAEVRARDPANSDGFLLSDGLEFTVCP